MIGTKHEQVFACAAMMGMILNSAYGIDLAEGCSAIKDIKKAIEQNTLRNNGFFTDDTAEQNRANGYYVLYGGQEVEILFDTTAICAGDIPRNVRSIVIPTSVISIGNHAFYGCTGLTQITIPSCVTSIGNSAFKGCRNLTRASLDSIYAVYKRILQSASKKTAAQNHANGHCVLDDGARIEIPFGITTIDAGTIPSNAVSITIPGSVTSISEYAFDHCTSLTSVSILSSVVSIGNNAFNACRSLTSISAPNNGNVLKRIDPSLK